MATAKSNVIPFPAPGARRAPKGSPATPAPADTASPSLVIMAARWLRVERELARLASNNRREA